MFKLGITQVLSTVTHHPLQVIKCYKPIIICVKKTEGLAKFQLSALLFCLEHHDQELIEVYVSTA